MASCQGWESQFLNEVLHFVAWHEDRHQRVEHFVGGFFCWKDDPEVTRCIVNGAEIR